MTTSTTTITTTKTTTKSNNWLVPPSPPLSAFSTRINISMSRDIFTGNNKRRTKTHRGYILLNYTRIRRTKRSNEKKKREKTRI